jgi:transposase
MKPIPTTLARKDIARLREWERGKKRAREFNRARALLLLHRGQRECDIARALGIDRKTVWRTKKRYHAEGIKAALEEKPRPGQPKKYTIRHETELVAQACSTPPEGRKRWTLVLLSERMRDSVKGCRTMNRESIRLMLKKTKQSLG